MINLDPPPLKCPACGQKEERVKFFCTRCWGTIPPKERASLRNMWINHQPLETKMAKLVLLVKDKLGLR